MGWDGIELKNETPAQFVRRDIEAAGNEVVRLYHVGPAIYAAVRLGKPDTMNQAGDVIALVIGTRQEPNWCHFKWMHEAEGPCYYDAPAELLEVLTTCEAMYAPAWRARCRETIADKAAGRPPRVSLLSR